MRVALESAAAMVSSFGATTAPMFRPLFSLRNRFARLREFIYAVRVFFNKFLDRATDRISSILSASAVATCRPCGVKR